MIKIKVIDLLNKIANGEEPPKKIKYINYLWEYKNVDYKTEDDSFLSDYFDINETGLNEEVEIIEEDKKIEKLKYDCIDQDGLGWYKLQTLSDKIDEIIDKINEE